MAANSSRVKATFDAAASLALKTSDTPVTVGTEAYQAAGVSLNELDQAYWHGLEIPYGALMVQVQVKSMVTGGGETYSIELVVDDTVNAADTPTKVAHVTPKAAGVYYALVDAKSLAAQDTETSGLDKWLNIRAIAVGAGSSIVYNASVVKNLRA